MTKAYEDKFNSGIIDTPKVTHSAVQGAASITAVILTSEVLIV